MSDDFFAHARKELYPKMQASALSIVLLGDPDPKLCMELGAAILFDKPIICVVPTGRRIPANLRRVASSIVEGEMDHETTRDRLQEAINNVLGNDQRVWM